MKMFHQSLRRRLNTGVALLLGFAMSGIVAFANENHGVPMTPNIAEDGLAAQGYHLVKVKSDQIDQEMKIATLRSNGPDSLKGLWWMDGNPLPDKVLTLAGSDYQESTRSLVIKVYDEDIWSWHGDAAGRTLYNLANRFHLEYQIKFNPNLTLGEITPIITVHGVRVTIPPSLVRFTMRYVRDGLWIRDSYFFGDPIPFSYRLRRIVMDDGLHDAAFADYLKSAPTYSYVARKDLPDDPY